MRAQQNALATPGKGILASDESVGTIGKRFSAINVANTEENRVRYRELLFTAPGIGNYISGAIVFEETLTGKGRDGELLIDKMKASGIIPGIKVDRGLTVIPGTEGESSTQGLDGLADRCKAYYAAGARFAKWRAVYKISENTPSTVSTRENSWTLARCGAICQQNGLVPIIEPEVLMDGTHDIERAAHVTENVLVATYSAMMQQGLLLEGTLLKPNMVCAGMDYPGKVTGQDIAAYTIRTLQRAVPVAVPAVVFLSGGQSEEEATQNLNWMNSMPAKKPWALTFSYGRALQQSCLQAWQGKDENVEAAQQVFLHRARCNGDAQLGRYKGKCKQQEGTGEEDKSLHVNDYRY
mmetsp:Transcript_43814/g.105942  ORF Transcript_43814/g.105942 Transcript_43814/m.105942 type:complete len:352 (+) Transcript_43814:44-1099(+)